VTVNPQDFSFEQLKPPLAAEDFSQIQARLRFLPPSYLRPRRSTENLQGVVLEGAEQVQFDVARQQLTAVLRDARQGTARLLHPFHSRAAAGFGSLASTLEKRAAQVRFVCGRVQATSQGLVVRPTLVIFDDGSRRIGLNPWVAMRAQNEPANGESAAAASLEMRESPSPVQQFLEELQQSLAELLLTGVARNAAAQQIVAERAEQSRRIGFVNLAAATDRLAGALAERSQKLNWSPAQAIGHFQQLCLMTRIAAE
jgi:hypothetical protein